MTINISDVAITIGQQSNSITWWEFFKIIFSVSLGGFMTYKATKKIKFKEIKHENIQKFILLSQITYFCFEDAYIYKEQLLKPIKQKIDKKQEQLFENISSLYIPKNEFNIDLKEYIFLGGFNYYFPDLLNKTNIIYQIFKQSIENYNEFVKNDITFKVIYKQDYVFNKNSYVKAFENLETLTDELLIRLYLILENCNTCYDKYYNLGHFDDIKDNFNKLNLKKSEGLEDILNSESYKTYQKTFDINWIDQPRLIYVVCHLGRTFKHYLRGLKEFFSMPKEYSLFKKNKEKKHTNES